MSFVLPSPGTALCSIWSASMGLLQTSPQLHVEWCHSDGLVSQCVVRKSHKIYPRLYYAMFCCGIFTSSRGSVLDTQIARLMGPTWGRQDPYGPHELCYLGICPSSYSSRLLQLYWGNITSTGEATMNNMGKIGRHLTTTKPQKRNPCPYYSWDVFSSLNLNYKPSRILFVHVATYTVVQNILCRWWLHPCQTSVEGVATYTWRAQLRRSRDVWHIPAGVERINLKCENAIDVGTLFSEKYWCEKDVSNIEMAHLSS